MGFYRRENLEVVKEGDLFRAYIRLSLDVNEGRRLISDPSQGSSRDDRLRQLDQMDSNVQYDPTNNNVSSCSHYISPTLLLHFQELVLGTFDTLTSQNITGQGV